MSLFQFGALYVIGRINVVCDPENYSSILEIDSNRICITTTTSWVNPEVMVSFTYNNKNNNDNHGELVTAFQQKM